MEEIINNLLKIDDKAKSIILEYEDKRNNLDFYISEEILRRKKEVDSKYKYKLDFKRKDCQRKLQEKIEIMKEIKDKGIEELNFQYKLEKENLISNIVNSIISEGE